MGGRNGERKGKPSLEFFPPEWARSQAYARTLPWRKIVARWVEYWPMDGLEKFFSQDGRLGPYDLFMTFHEGLECGHIHDYPKGQGNKRRCWQCTNTPEG